MALFTRSREVEKVRRFVRTAPASLIGVKAEEIVVIEVLIKDIVADSRPFGFFVVVPDLVTAKWAQQRHQIAIEPEHSATRPIDRVMSCLLR